MQAYDPCGPGEDQIIEKIADSSSGTRFTRDETRHPAEATRGPDDE